MSNESKAVFVHCPKCHKSGNIEVPVEKIMSKKSGLTLIVVNKLICEHAFLAYIDRNFTMRESEELYYVQSPKLIDESKEVQEVVFDENELDIIKLNLYSLPFSYILKCFFNKKKILVVVNDKQDFLVPIYDKLFNYLFSNTFDIQYQILPIQEYSDKKNSLDVPIIIKSVDILKDEENFLSENEFGVERGFINKFYSEEYGPATLKTLKMQINNAYNLALKTKDFIQNTKRPNINGIIKYLKKEFGIKVNVTYAEFLLDILQNYFKIQTKAIYKNIEFLKFKKLGK